MNFLKNNLSMVHEDQTPNTVPSSTSPEFQNAQALEEPGAASSPTTSDNARQSSEDPFASQREPGFKWDMFETERADGTPESPTATHDRRMSKEWDASKVPPSRFQKREGSIHATPASRDGHIDRNKLKAFNDKFVKKERRKSEA